MSDEKTETTRKVSKPSRPVELQVPRQPKPETETYRIWDWASI